MEAVDPNNLTEVKAVQDSIDRLRQYELDPADEAVLEVLSRRICFTERQKLLLARMEQDYLKN
jgi:hypothetical protein